MKNRWKKIIMIVGICSAMSLAVYGCGGEADSGEAPAAEVVSGQDDEADSDAAGKDKASEEGASSGQNGEVPDASAQEELLGDIMEVTGDGKFVVNKIYSEELEDGSGIMVVGSSEENPDLVSVSYDENTEFVWQTIWNGGADHEEKPSSSDALTKGVTAEMKGYYEGEVFHAVYIQLVEVVL